MRKASLNPTADQTFEVVGEGPYDFARVLDRARKMQEAGDVEGACNERFRAFQRLAELIPEDEEVNLEWTHRNSRAALELVRASAIDHFLINDFEMSAALLEMLLELDPEDHLEATTPLAFSYVALEEYELFGEVINDISDKYPEKEILKLWSEFRQTGKLPQGELIHFKKSFPIFYAEFIANRHEVTPEYLTDIESEKPTRQTLARELWLQTEHLWHLFPGFIEALSTH